jgi:hypothetical protein
MSKKNGTKPLEPPAVSSSASKYDRLAMIDAEMYVKRNCPGEEKLSHLCAFISTLTKGTKYKELGISIIRSTCDDFFQ